MLHDAHLEDGLAAVKVAVQVALDGPAHALENDQRGREREIEGGRGTWVCGSKEYSEEVVT